MEKHSVNISNLNSFSASSLTFKNKVGKLNSHNYEVSIYITSETLNKCSYVTDFGLVTPILREICLEMDKKFLLPSLSSNIKNQRLEDKCIHIAEFVDGTSISLPIKDVKLIEIECISPELLAKHISQKFMQKFNKSDLDMIKIIKIKTRVQTFKGFYGEYSYHLNND